MTLNPFNPSGCLLERSNCSSNCISPVPRVQTNKPIENDTCDCSGEVQQVKDQCQIDLKSFYNECSDQLGELQYELDIKNSLQSALEEEIMMAPPMAPPMMAPPMAPPMMAPPMAPPMMAPPMMAPPMARSSLLEQIKGGSQLRKVSPVESSKSPLLEQIVARPSLRPVTAQLIPRQEESNLSDSQKRLLQAQQARRQALEGGDDNDWEDFRFFRSRGRRYRNRK